MNTIMPCRYAMLQQLIEGYAQTHVPLIAYNGSRLLPFNNADDIGMYYIVTYLVHYGGYALDDALRLLLYGPLYIGVIVAIISFYLMFRSYYSVVISSVCMSAISYLFIAKIYDVYLISAAITLLAVPFGIYLLHHQRSIMIGSIGMCVIGCLIGIAHAIRSYAGYGSLLFLCVLVVCAPHWQRRQRCMLLVLLLVSLLIPTLCFKKVYADYRAYAQQEYPAEVVQLDRHVFWHAIYVGLGFLSNPYGILYDDTYAMTSAMRINPSVEYCSAEYERILRDETIAMCVHHPLYVLKVVFAKFGVLLLYFLLFCNVGILTAYLFPKEWYIDGAFTLLLAFEALPGLLVMPEISYVLGFIMASLLYGLYSINYSICAYSRRKAR